MEDNSIIQADNQAAGLDKGMKLGCGMPIYLRLLAPGTGLPIRNPIGALLPGMEYSLIMPGAF